MNVKENLEMEEQLVFLFVDACVEFCFLKNEFVNLTINMQYYISFMTSNIITKLLSNRLH